MSPLNARRAYHATFRYARSLAGIDASASRLRRHPDVKAYMALIRAYAGGEIPRPHGKPTAEPTLARTCDALGNSFPSTAGEIRELFIRHRCWYRLRQL